MNAEFSDNNHGMFLDSSLSFFSLFIKGKVANATMECASQMDVDESRCVQRSVGMCFKPNVGNVLLTISADDFSVQAAVENPVMDIDNIDVIEGPGGMCI